MPNAGVFAIGPFEKTTRRSIAISSARRFRHFFPRGRLKTLSLLCQFQSQIVVILLYYDVSANNHCFACYQCSNLILFYMIEKTGASIRASGGAIVF